MKKTFLLILAIPAAIAVLTYFPIQNKKKAFHSDQELAFFKQHGDLLNFAGQGTTGGPGHELLPIDSNILFPTAKTCGGCHGFDQGMHASITTSGVDVNVYDDWRSTMMANSSKDPFWRAKVTHEMLVNPAHSIALQDKCTSCHAPAGHYQAKLKAHQAFYLLNDVYTDTLGLDGVTCQVCHAQSPKLLGVLHSGALNFDTARIRVAYGPYEFAFAPPMHNFVGITPVYGPHIGDAGLCAGCHTLITSSVDENGVLTGKTFVEQATYHEWLNSRYDKEHDNITCQGCHIPQLMDEIIISANYQFLTPKFPYGLHELAGANIPMLKLLKENRDKLHITAKPEHFDSTIAATLRMLQHKSLDVTLQPGILNGDSVTFNLRLQNKAGHKFPSGYPSRRAWVEFVVQDQAGNTVFHSGKMNPDYTIQDENPGQEPHYNLIDAPDKVQIYELVPGDLNGNFTNVLERGYVGLKDNRLTPKGFKMNDPVYDTTEIIGAALTDPDFNRNPDGSEGSGADIVHYQIPTNGYTGYLHVTARVWYQSLPPKWMDPMFEYSSPEIDSFKQMYLNADRAPILVSEVALDSVYVTTVGAHNPANQATAMRIAPNPTGNGKIQIRFTQDVRIKKVKVWNSAGILVWDEARADLMLPPARGVYFIRVETDKGVFQDKILRN